MHTPQETKVSCKLLCAIVLSTVLAVAGVASPCASAAEPHQTSADDKRPALLLSITIEGLDADILDLLRGTLTDGGFNRLIGQSLVIEQPQYGPGMCPTSATALLYTGASPDVNGIAGSTRYDASHNLATNIFTDSTTAGHHTAEMLSPKALKVSTFSDQAKVAAEGLNHIYALAPHSQQALVMGGHAANSAFWIDETTGKWVSSSYYKDMPQAVTTRNYRQSVSNLLDTLDWRPLLPLNQYPDLPATLNQARFLHHLPASNHKRYNTFKGTAYANTEVTDLALQLMHYQMLGKHTGVDVLSLAYTVTPDGALDMRGGGRVETLDSYVRLDRDLRRLFQSVDTLPGMDRTVILVAGVPSREPGRPSDPKWGLPGGTFSASRARSLLNMFLMAMHGNGDWVSGYHNRHFYLNHALIKQRGLDAGEIRAAAADFLTRMSGVSHAYAIDDITAGRAGSDPDAMRRNTPVEGAGDIVISVAPGWEAVDDISGAPTFVANDAFVPSPIYIAAPGVASRHISEPVDARTIAPTVSRLLRIRSPNGASLPPVRL